MDVSPIAIRLLKFIFSHSDKFRPLNLSEWVFLGYLPPAVLHIARQANTIVLGTTLSKMNLDGKATLQGPLL